MKFSIGEKVIIWKASGAGIYDGLPMYIVGYRTTDNVYRVSDRSQGSEVMGYISESGLLKFSEWQNIAIEDTTERQKRLAEWIHSKTILSR